MKKSKVIIAILFMTLMSNLAFTGAPPEPEPPKTNPNPPRSKKDQARVDFALKMAKQFLGTSHTLQIDPENKTYGQFKSKDLTCINDSKCWQKDISFLRELKVLQSRGLMRNPTHAHLIPWALENYEKRQKAHEKNDQTKEMTKPSIVSKSIAIMGPSLKPDEYMVHVYVQFGPSNRWHHLDIILSEDKNGNLQFRHFYSTPMPRLNYKLPDGVVC